MEEVDLLHYVRLCTTTVREAKSEDLRVRFCSTANKSVYWFKPSQCNITYRNCSFVSIREAKEEIKSLKKCPNKIINSILLQITNKVLEFNLLLPHKHAHTNGKLISFKNILIPIRFSMHASVMEE